MKKIIVILVLVIILNLGLFAEKIRDFNEMYQNPSIYMSKDYLYIVNGETCVTDVYEIVSLKKIKSFGKKGEGPQEVKFRPRLYIFKDQMVMESSGKFLFYNLMGDFIKEQTINSSYFWAQPLGEKFVAMSNSNDEAKKIRHENCGIYSLDQENSEIQILKKSSSKMGGRSLSGGKPRWELPGGRWSFKTSDNLVVLGDPINTCSFAVFDSEGKKISEIDYPYEKQKISTSDQKRLLAEDEKRFGKAITARHRKMFKYEFSEYFPSFRIFRIIDKKLYLMTHRVKEGRREVLILDLKGKLLKKTSVVESPKGAFQGDKYYYLKDNQDTEKWELHAENV